MNDWILRETMKNLRRLKTHSQIPSSLLRIHHPPHKDMWKRSRYSVNRSKSTQFRKSTSRSRPHIVTVRVESRPQVDPSVILLKRLNSNDTSKRNSACEAHRHHDLRYLTWFSISTHKYLIHWRSVDRKREHPLQSGRQCFFFFFFSK